MSKKNKTIKMNAEKPTLKPAEIQFKDVETGRFLTVKATPTKDGSGINYLLEADNGDLSTHQGLYVALCQQFSNFLGYKQ